MQQQILRSRRLPVLVICVALAVLGGAITVAGLRLRHDIRRQIANRDGEALYAVSRLQRLADESGNDLGIAPDDPASQFTHILVISRLKGVVGVRLFSAEGGFINAFPAYITEALLLPDDLPQLQTLKPVSHYLPAARLADFDILSEDDPVRVPLLVVNLPLHASNQSKLQGVAQFILQGGSIAEAFAALDRSLVAEAAVVFLAAGGILVLALILAFRRIQRAQRLLADRTASLLQANQELALSAKVSAVGAVTAHLIHGLKNPLSGLQSFVNNHAEGTDADWKEAVATTHRMQGLISEVVRILSEQQTEADYELTLEELVQTVSAKAAPLAREAGVEFVSHSDGDGALSNREANLVTLILENLIQNALQATPRGRSVRLLTSHLGGQVAFEVQDQGPGLPPAVCERLFTPCRSTKEGGSGIGLAISKQLATHLGGTLELKSNSASGCVFRLTVPVAPTAKKAFASAQTQPLPENSRHR